MIYVDANIFLRLLAAPVTVEDQRMAAASRALFEAVERGDTDVTTTEIVLHEVAYMLASRGHYGQTVPQVVASLSAILQFPGFKLPSITRSRYLRALELWETYPVLGFADALLATVTLENEGELATFDGDFDRVPGLRRWQPAATA